MITRVFIAALFLLLFWGNLFPATAQDTFGPVCDGITITCPPTASPTIPLPTQQILPTQPVQATSVPPTTAPTAMPRAGTTTSMNVFLLLGGTFMISGVVAQFVLTSKRKS